MRGDGPRSCFRIAPSNRRSNPCNLRSTQGRISESRLSVAGQKERKPMGNASAHQHILVDSRGDALDRLPSFLAVNALPRISRAVVQHIIMQFNTSPAEKCAVSLTPRSSCLSSCRGFTQAAYSGRFLPISINSLHIRLCKIM